MTYKVRSISMNARNEVFFLIGYFTALAGVGHQEVGHMYLTRVLQLILGGGSLMIKDAGTDTIKVMRDPELMALYTPDSLEIHEDMIQSMVQILMENRFSKESTIEDVHRCVKKYGPDKVRTYAQELLSVINHLCDNLQPGLAEQPVFSALMQDVTMGKVNIVDMIIDVTDEA